MKKIITLLSIFYFTLPLLSQENFNLELVSNLEYDELLADVTGYVADDGTEYAIVGVFNGFSVVSLEDPENPEEVLFINGHNSFWRDMKAYGNYVYGVADVGEDGMVIIDMTGAPNNIEFEFWRPQLTVNNQTNFLNRCHNIFVDPNGRAYLSGCNLNGGGVLIVDVDTDPLNPEFLGAAPPIYSHDNYVLNNIMYSSEITFGEFSIYDVTDPTNVLTLGSQNTSSNSTHNAWASDDNTYLFTTDEVANGFVDAYDVSDPDNITFLSSFRPKSNEGEGVIPHNAHYHNGYVIVSWYTDGVVVIDAHRPENMVKVGQYDTFQGSPGGFNGCWGANPFLPSGLILASDRQNGLFVLQPDYIRASYLEGQVTSAATGGNIPNVEVEILDDFPNGKTTGADGLYKTGIPKTGTFDVKFSHPDYIEKIVEVELEAGEITELDVELQPIPCDSPTMQAFNFTVLDVQPEQLEIGWVRGNGNQVIVLAKEGGAVDSFPEEGQSYQANSVFGQGDMIGNGNYVVYIGPGNSVNVSGLTEQTSYGFAVFEFFTFNLCYTTPPLFGNGTTSSSFADIELEKIASEDTAFPGDTVVFTFTITNNGPGEAINPTLTDTLPKEFIYLSSDPEGTFDNGVFSWTTSNLANGQSIEITLSTLVDQDAEPGIVINNAQVEIDNNDPNPSNNSDQAEVEILCQPDHECQDDIIVYLDEGSCSVEVQFDGEGCNFNSGETFSLGETLIVCTFINSCEEEDECEFTISVLDTIPPVISQCPEGRTIIGCSTDDLGDPSYSNNLTTTDQATFESALNQGLANDNCYIVEYTYIDEQVTDCPYDFVRTWTVTDSSGNSVSCEQSISIQPSSLDLICPEDEIVNPCPEENDLEFDFAEWLSTIQVSGGCDPIVEHNGFEPPSVCGGSITVTFELTDNCSQSIQCSASFSVEGNSVSVLCPDNMDVNTDESSCTYQNIGNALDPVVSGVCGEFTMNYSLTGATSGSGQLSLDSVEFNVGTTTVNWEISGNCVNLSCSFEVTVTDDISPDIECPADTTMELSAGQDSIFIELVEAAADDNCGIDFIENDYNGGGADASDYYFAGVTAVTFTATDDHGNSTQCSTVIEVLLDGGLSLYTISGNIQTFTGEVLSDVSMGVSGSTLDTFIVNSPYSLDFTEGSNITLNPEKEDSWLDGLSTFDLALIQRHVIQLEHLSNPYAIIAADANKDGKINTIDLVLLQNIILGNISDINGENPWSFVEADYEFDDPENPLDEEWPEEISFNELDTHYTDQSWIAIKLGDVNGNWENGSSRIVLPDFPLYALNKSNGEKGNSISVVAGKNTSISAFQIALEFKTYDLHSVEPDFTNSVLPGFQEDWYHFTEDGKLRIIWYHPESIDINKGDRLFKLTYNSFETGEEPKLQVARTDMQSLIFGAEGAAERLTLAEVITYGKNDFALYQNNPNPFQDQTTISWRLPAAMEVNIEVRDALGRLLHTEVKEGEEGLNTSVLRSDSWPSGVLFYRISVDGWSASKGMILKD